MHTPVVDGTRCVVWQRNVDANQHLFPRAVALVRELDWRAPLPTPSCPQRPSTAQDAAPTENRYAWSPDNAEELEQVRRPLNHRPCCRGPDRFFTNQPAAGDVMPPPVCYTEAWTSMSWCDPLGSVLRVHARSAAMQVVHPWASR